MNERYTTDKHTGVSRKSAASAKPKSKAASSVTVGRSKKTPKERKAEQKQARKEETARQREIDRKYYTPDTPRYKKLRKIFWGTMIGAIVLTAASWLLRQTTIDWLAIACLIGAYACIIAAFYVDFAKIRKERKAYQNKMLALEIEERKKNKGKGGNGSGSKGKGPKGEDSNDKDKKGK